MIKYLIFYHLTSFYFFCIELNIISKFHIKSMIEEEKKQKKQKYLGSIRKATDSLNNRIEVKEFLYNTILN